MFDFNNKIQGINIHYSWSEKKLLRKQKKQSKKQKNDGKTKTKDKGSHISANSTTLDSPKLQEKTNRPTNDKTIPN